MGVKSILSEQVDELQCESYYNLNDCRMSSEINFKFLDVKSILSQCKVTFK